MKATSEKLHQMTRHSSTDRTASMHQGSARCGVLEVCVQHCFHGAKGAVGRGGAGINRTSDGSEHMGRERREPLHVLKAGVEITAGDHRAVEGLQQFRGDVDQLVFHGSGFLGPCHDLAPCKTGAVEIVLVGHQTGQPLTIGDTGFVTWVIE